MNQLVGEGAQALLYSFQTARLPEAMRRDIPLTLNWHCDPSYEPYKAALIDILGEPLKPEQLWNPDAMLRVEDIQHRPDTQDRLDKAGFVNGEVIHVDGGAHAGKW